MKFVLALVCIAALGAAALGWWSWQDFTTPVEHNMASRTFNIAQGSSTEQIVERLQADGIVEHGSNLRAWIKLQGVGAQIQAGDFTFASPISPQEVLQKLLEGGKAANKLTIIEGWTRWDIAHAMAAIPSLHLKNADQALTLMNDTSSIKDLDPTATSLEGYMFPDTYFVQSTTTAKELLETSVDHFHQVWKKDLQDLAAARKQTAHDVVTIGSIIETEAKLMEERPMMASVIYNRLQKGTPLGVDSTIVYASKLAGKWHNNGIVYMSDVNRNSPYNTRKVAGLPPGPVSNPGLSSMKAALQPANTGFIYYVREPSRNDGAHNFYIDAAGFEIGVQKLRAWERANRGKTATVTTTTTTTKSVAPDVVTPSPAASATIVTTKTTETVKPTPTPHGTPSAPLNATKPIHSTAPAVRAVTTSQQPKVTLNAKKTEHHAPAKPSPAKSRKATAHAPARQTRSKSASHSKHGHHR